MSLELEFDPNGVAWLTASGDLSFADTIDGVRRLCADPRFAVPARAVWDLRAGRALLTGEEVRSIADEVRAHPNKALGRTAIVVGDDLTFGTGRMVEQMTSESLLEVHVFRDLEPATRWLVEKP